MTNARKVKVLLSIDGVDISQEIKDDLISLVYSDNEEDEADDIQITLHDRGGKWLNAWLDDMLIAQLNTDTGLSKTKGLAILPKILCENWAAPGQSMLLDCGGFELDEIYTSGPPATITLKGTSLTYRNGIRSTEKSKSWENYYLAGIGKEIAGNAGMGYIFDSGYDPLLERREQNSQTDISFLKTLCHNAGCSLKISDGKLIIFDQSKYEKAPNVATIRFGDGSYSKWRLRSSESDVDYTSCLVRYLHPLTGTLIQGKAYSGDYDSEEDKNKTLVVTNYKVNSVAEADVLAEKLLRLKN